MLVAVAPIALDMAAHELHRALTRLRQRSQGTRRADQFAEAEFGFGDFSHALAP